MERKIGTGDTVVIPRLVADSGTRDESSEAVAISIYRKTVIT